MTDADDFTDATRPPPPVRCPACRATLYPPPDLTAAGCAAAVCEAAVCPLRDGPAWGRWAPPAGDHPAPAADGSVRYRNRPADDGRRELFDPDQEAT